MKNQNGVILYEKGDIQPKLVSTFNTEQILKYGIKNIGTEEIPNWIEAEESDIIKSEAKRLNIDEKDVELNYGCFMRGDFSCYGGCSKPNYTCVQGHDPSNGTHYCICVHG